jgi:hypothetical protein
MATRTKVRRIEVTPRAHPPVPTDAAAARYKRPGKAYRWKRMGESPAETEAMIEEMADRGWRLVTKDGKPDGTPVQHRNALLFEIDAKTYHRRMEERVQENIRQNRAQAEEIKRGLRSRISPTGERPRVRERGVTYEPEEPVLLPRGQERFENQPDA